jgi:cytochrome c553
MDVLHEITPSLSIIIMSLSGNEKMELFYLVNACNACHGMYGEGMGASPRLQGQKEAVLLRRLKDLQKGKTRSAFGTIMISFAKSLDENQTREMAKYLSSMKKIIPKERYELDNFDNTGDGSS